jgi:hypothetical protein
MLMLKSPFHYKNKDMVNFTESKSMRIGSMVHTLALEPHLFDSEYIIKPELLPLPKVGRLKDLGKEEFEWQKEDRQKVVEQNALKTEDFALKLRDDVCVADEKEVETARIMTASLTDNNQIDSLLMGCDVEKSIFWTDEKTGIALKARPDAWNGSLIIDLKTTKSADPRKFMYSCLDYGYFIQAAMIQEALRSIGQVMDRYIIVCVENSAPYAPAIFVLSEAAIEYGYSKFRLCLDKLSECMKTGEWPSYPTEMLDIPDYLRNHDE